MKEKKPERKQMYEDPEIMKQRNKLIEYINHDVARHIEE